MNNPFPAIVAHFRNHEWNFTQDEERPILRMGFSGDNGEWRCAAAVEWDETQFAFYSILPARAAIDARPAIAELVTRINYGLFTGGFEIDWSDGEIRMKTSLLLYGEELPDEMIHQVVGQNLTTMDEYFPAFLKVLYLRVTPPDAIRKAEDQQAARPRFELN